MTKESVLNQLLDNENEKEIINLSYSKLSDFDRNGPKALITKTSITNEGIKHGSIVDDLLTDLQTGSTLFEDKYIVENITKPSATLGLLSEIIIEKYESPPTVEEILYEIKDHGFWSNVKNVEKLEANFNNKEFWEYIKFKIKHKSTSKLIVTSSEYADALNAIDSLINHPHSAKIFTNDDENIYQFRFEYMYNDVLLRGFIDKINIDHSNKKVTFYDLKTGANKGESFIKSFIDYRYYYQAAIYTNAFPTFCKEFNLEGYTLEPFKFIYIGKTENIPYIFTSTEKWYNFALKGGSTKSGFKYVGIDENIEKVKFHFENNLFDYSKEIYLNEGVINLNDYFIDAND